MVNIQNNVELGNHFTQLQLEMIQAKLDGMSSRNVAEKYLGSKSKKSSVNDLVQRYLKLVNEPTMPVKRSAKVLLLDIETSPLKSYTWGLWQQNVGLNQIEGEWFILSFAAKWLGAPEYEIFYDDLRGIVGLENDYKLLKQLWELLNEADVIITQNGKKFDAKKINARLIMNGFQPPRPYKHIDTLQIAKAVFGFTSNKLEWMSDKLCTKYKKQKHSKFSGFDLWKGMLDDNIEAWNECEVYNKYDVLSLEELYTKLAPWDKTHPNYNLYTDEATHVCRCGSHNVVEDGFAFTSKSKFQQYRCLDCGATTRASKNLFDKEKRDSLHLNVMS